MFLYWHILLVLEPCQLQTHWNTILILKILQNYLIYTILVLPSLWLDSPLETILNYLNKPTWRSCVNSLFMCDYTIHAMLCSLLFIFPEDYRLWTLWERSGCSLISLAIRRNTNEKLFVILHLDSFIYTLENQVYFGTVMDEVMADLLKLWRVKALDLP